nr:hypothetical protein [Tanacetum cinerariifolium]
MFTDEIKNSKHYQTLLALSTGLMHPKKSRGKGSKGKKATVTPKKKSSITLEDNIIPKHDVAFELGKYTSRSKAKEQEEARCVHEIHERLVSKKPTSVEEYDESDGKPANRPTGKRRPSGVVFKDTSNVSKKKSLDVSQKLNGVIIVSEEEQLTTDIMQAIKASRRTYRIQRHIKGSSKGAAKVNAAIDWGSKDESDWSDDAKVNEGEIKFLSSDDEEEIHDDDDDISINIKETDKDERTESDNDKYVADDAAKEMKDGKDAKTGKDDKEMTGVEKADVEKTEEAKGDHEQVRIVLAKVDQAKDVNVQDNQATPLAFITQNEMPKIPPTSSSLSI